MADVNLAIGGHHYTVSCRDGEEEHLQSIGSMVNSKTREAKLAVGDGLGEARQLLFAALLLADEANELRKNSLTPDQQEQIGKLSARLTELGEKLAPAAKPS